MFSKMIRRGAMLLVGLGVGVSEVRATETAGEAMPIVTALESSAPSRAAGTSLDGEPDFERDIRPILRAACYECHAGTTEEGGLNLGIKSRAMNGGDSGPAIVVGNSHDSLLMALVAGDDEDRIMPPAGRPRLSEGQIETLRAWIDRGAVWPESADVVDPKLERAQAHWAFQRLSPVSEPRPDATDDWSRGAIDRFVQQRLRQVDLQPAASADGRTLVRRLYFDLIGLPPTPEQSRRFLAAHADNPDGAVAALVDELLDSPHYGERWARHWLDVARYADSDGQESDQDRRHAYTYRDFVIQALNDDMPYDQFVRWQIAGDEYEPQLDAAVAATGFLAAGPAFKLPDSFLESERLLNRYNELDDVISTLGSGLLGLTVGCARCHDHKSDAFSAKEYYQLLGVFHSGDRVTTQLPSGKEAFVFRDFDDQRRTTWLFRRSDFYDREIEVPLGFPAALSSGAEADDYWQAARAAYAVTGGPPTTLQRRALAEWLTDTQQGGGALLARVIVNRVWHHHFGTGLVATTGDFGVQGDPPSHPELLEYLTHEFVASGWRLKTLHRLILTSAVWRQASARDSLDPRGTELDPTNRWLWRRLPQRLEAESLRDAILAISETLNLEAGGFGFKPYIAPEANQARNIKGEGYPQNAPDDPSTRRRSVYMFHKRLIPYPMFQAFDRPDLMVSCSRRQNTTVAPQAMVLLNDRLVRTVAGDFARLLHGHAAAGREVDHAIERTLIAMAYERAFTRLPTERELELAEQFLIDQTQRRIERSEPEPQLEAWADFCQALFGLNEFLYID